VTGYLPPPGHLLHGNHHCGRLPPPVKSTVYWVTVWGYGWVTRVRVRITVMVRLRGKG